MELGYTGRDEGDVHTDLRRQQLSAWFESCGREKGCLARLEQLLAGFLGCSEAEGAAVVGENDRADHLLLFQQRPLAPAGELEIQGGPFRIIELVSEVERLDHERIQQ